MGPGNRAAHRVSVSPELVAQAVRGDRGAEAQVLEAIHAFVHRMLYRMLGANNPTADLEDLEQTVLLRVLQAMPRYKPRASFTTWVGGICVNVVRDHLRRRKVRAVVTSEGGSEDLPRPGGHPSPADASLVARDQLRLCERALATLSDPQRTVFVLRVLEGHSIDEIAAMTSAARSTTRLRLYYGRKAFARALEAVLAAREEAP